MTEKTALKRRIAPSVPLRLELTDDSGGSFSRSFRLCFDYNAGAEIEQRTGRKLTELKMWADLGPKDSSVIFWAAILANHPEYRTVDADGEPTDEGLEVIRSYMDEANEGQITEALWKAYLAFVPKVKREFLIQFRADLEAKEKAKADAKGSGEVPLARQPAAEPAVALDEPPKAISA